jgi:hypothetical protein
MSIHNTLALSALLFTAPAWADDKSMPPLEASLKVQFAQGQTVAAANGKAPVELQFMNPAKKGQKFANTEYGVAVLDHNGEQVKGAIAVTTELRDVLLTGPVTTDRPGISFVPGKLQSGEEYYLVVSVRNLIGHVKFKAK